VWLVLGVVLGCFLFFVENGLNWLILFLVQFLCGFVDSHGVLVALANFKYRLGLIMVLRLISWLNLPKKPRRRLQRRNKAVLQVY
jgi:hypothetical protein